MLIKLLMFLVFFCAFLAFLGHFLRAFWCLKDAQNMDSPTKKEKKASNARQKGPSRPCAILCRRQTRASRATRARDALFHLSRGVCLSFSRSRGHAQNAEEKRSVSFSPGGWTAFVYVALFDTFRIPAPTQLKNTVPLSGSGWMLNVTPKNARTVRKH